MARAVEAVLSAVTDALKTREEVDRTMAALDESAAKIRSMLFPGQAAQPASRTGTPSKSDFATEAEAIRVLLRRAVATRDLVKAASTENLVAARDALAAGANPNYVNGRGQSALSFALYRGDIPMLDLLLKPPVPALPPGGP